MKKKTVVKKKNHRSRTVTKEAPKAAERLVIHVGNPLQGDWQQLGEARCVRFCLPDGELLFEVICTREVSRYGACR